MKSRIRLRCLLLTLVMCTINMIASADNEHLLYEYDAAGNRISRTVVQGQPRQSPRNSLPSVDISVSPTLTHDEVIISTAMDIETYPTRYTLVNLQGSVLMMGNLYAQQTRLSLGQYADGIYLLRVESDVFSKSYKIIKH